MKLNSKQRAFIRSKAHGLKPVVQIGSAGLSDTAVQSVLDAFNTREVLKVRVQEAAPEDAWTTADAIVKRLDGVSVAQTIGRVVVLYRAFPDGPELKLPG